MIRGKNVLIRTMRDRDTETYFEKISDLAARGKHFPKFLHSEASFRKRYNETGYWTDDHGTFLIFDLQETRMLGQVAFFKTIHYWNNYELGYILFDPADRGKGIMTEAVRMVCKYLFDAKSILRITIQAEPENVASKKVAEKCGFKFEGVARSVFESFGKPTDIEVWSLTHADFYAAEEGA